ncbi:hypothetical protein [Actinocorallia sp. A-T 12471]|uniref:hypothetical protein n=1 Tax=Actinocorallia sp. A-T 12471 TaxID=3089813 RepID=UPI0029D27F3F|nr:hypothetical protein [Actinocorallia sp. A-T 12471]MDX6744442.1 hypothetical protein [Actinocorallia sp. A-T 12471]
MWFRRIGVLSVLSSVLLGCSAAPGAPEGADGTKGSDSRLEISRPLDAYLPTEEERANLGTAVTRLTNACLEKFNIADLHHVRPFLHLDGILDDQRPLGYFTVQYAEKYGYHSPPVEFPQEVAEQGEKTGPSTSSSAEEINVAYGGIQEYAGKPVPADGCRGEAMRTLSKGSPSGSSSKESESDRENYLLHLRAESSERSIADPAYLDMQEKWRSCMRSKGYSFASRNKAADNPDWNTAKASPKEIRTATADAECMDQVDYLDIFLKLIVKNDEVLVEENGERLQEIKEMWQTRVRNANDLVSGG